MNKRTQARKLKQLKEKAELIKNGEHSAHSLVLSKETVSALIKLKEPKLDKDKINEYSQIFVDYFGYSNWCLDNVLTKEDRDIFYALEEMGILTGEKRNVCLKPGKYWNSFTWHVRYRDIVNFVTKPFIEEETLEAELYNNLQDEAWQRG